MSEHDLVVGDAVYDELYDTALTVTERDGQWVTLEGLGVVTATVEQIERLVEAGQYTVLEREHKR